MAGWLSKRSAAALTAGAAVLVASGAGAAVAAGDDDATEHSISGTALDRASAAALAETGGGRVTDTEVGDEESRYEVEVTLPGGRQVDIQLDEDFDVVGTEGDGDRTDD